MWVCWAHRYAALEQKLGEIDRARAIYVHSATLAHPQRDRDFWTLWNDFEVAHGNEDTFREMLRIKRSVQAAFSNTHFNTTIVDASAAPSGELLPLLACTSASTLLIGLPCPRGTQEGPPSMAKHWYIWIRVAVDF